MDKLHIGDTFIEGDCTYKVTGIVPEGYLAVMIKGMDDIPEEPKVNEPKVEPKVEKTEEPTSYSKTQINRMPNTELEKLCKELGIEVGTGTEMKRALIKELKL